jgi:D-alanyl-D-alanine carboxypeptidase (penicillin-binding protein 5/6)
LGRLAAVYTYSRRSSISPLYILFPALLVVVIAVIQIARGLPAVDASITVAATTTIGEPRQLQLPTSGSTSVAVAGLGQLGSAGTTAARPIASVTKMMTAWVVLKDHPLKPGETGPSITTTSADATRYLQMVAQDQSALPVTAGQTFSELEMLQAMLIPSANNFAEMLAAWDAGSLPAFVQKMNVEAQALGMTNTRYADVSGFSSGSVSTALDQLALERELMKNPVFAQIVAMPQVRLPGIGLVSNVNELLGQDGVVGIKTGFTEDAGGNLAFAARKTVGGQQVDIIGAVLGQASRPAAFDATRRIIAQLNQSLQLAKVVPAGVTVATLDPAWSAKVNVVAGADAQMLYFPGMSLESNVEIDRVKAPLRAGDQVGWLNLKLGEQTQRIPLVLASDLPKASLIWKLTRT